MAGRSQRRPCRSRRRLPEVRGAPLHAENAARGLRLTPNDRLDQVGRIVAHQEIEECLRDRRQSLAQALDQVPVALDRKVFDIEDHQPARLEFQFQRVHRHDAQAETGLALTLQERGRLEDAEPLLRSALQIRQRWASR